MRPNICDCAASACSIRRRSQVRAPTNSISRAIRSGIRARPVGLGAAIAARQRGLQVLVADRVRPPIDKPCGEGVMPEGVSALRLLGVPVDDGTLPFYGIRFSEGGS